ncbi:SagB family peptide dehydrogenase [Nonomuraea typhae]|uniref:SagB family peptide dehydrogenase n=1 Tax=Nonomuraea typhae TaxID=2603600 RepID=A0ABW7YUH8_9ACTN
MANTVTEIGEEYWRLTVHDFAQILSLGVGREGSPDEPPKFRILPGERVPLPSRIPLHLGDARAAIDGTTPPAGQVDPTLLSALLYYAFGFSRVVLGPTSPKHWPYHRFVPSARCFYPTEMFVGLNGDWGVPAGVYHYDQAHHALVRVRAGDFRELLSASLAADVEDASCLVFLTSLFWKNAFRYRHYSYRLCVQEAGLVAGNVLLVAGALGLIGHVHYQFLDEPVNRLLGLGPEGESTLSVVALYPRDRDPRRLDKVYGAAELARTLPAIEADVPGWPENGPRDLWSWVLDVDRATALTSTAEFARPLSRVPDDDGGIPLPGEDGERADLVTALRRRNSGAIMFNPEPGVLPAGQFARIVRRAHLAYASDAGATPFTRCYVVVHMVEGIEPGVYAVTGDGARLRRVSGEPARKVLDGLGVTPPSANLPTAMMVLYLVGDHRAALRAFGNRGYRILTQDAGILAQRLAVLCGSLSLSARIHNGMPALDVARALGLPERTHAMLFQLIVGRARVTGQYEPDIVF